MNRRGFLGMLAAAVAVPAGLSKCEYCGRTQAFPLDGGCRSCGGGLPAPVVTEEPVAFLASGYAHFGGGGFPVVRERLQAAVTRGTIERDYGPRIGFSDARQLQLLGVVPLTYDGVARIIGYADLDRLIREVESPRRIDITTHNDRSPRFLTIEP